MPSADALLTARLSKGWRPLPTDLVDGPEILGHAQTRCVVEADGRVTCEMSDAVLVRGDEDKDAQRGGEHEDGRGG